MTAAPGDGELVTALAVAFGRPVVELARAPYRYATSHPLEQLDVEIAGGERVTVIFKDLDPARQAPGAADGKPPVVCEPRREIDTYRHLLAGTGIGPRCHGAVSTHRRHWLFLAKVAGVELWQVGRFEVWEAVASWLASFHDRFAADAASLAARHPQLLSRDRSDFERWCRRAGLALARSGDARAPELARRLDAVTAGGFAACGRITLLHGELYPSNVLVGERSPVEVWPIDWEMAAVGPAAFDLAALLTGWGGSQRARLAECYRTNLARPPAPAELDAAVDACRLHLACQWLGWSPGWQAPAEHAHDWIGEALDALGRLER